jgi:hypothetical protein
MRCNMRDRIQIDLAPDRRNVPLEFRLAKVTTASSGSAAPYTSVASIYRGMWLNDSTARAAELTGAALWTLSPTSTDLWVLCVQTPFGHWEGVSIMSTVTHASQHPEAE